MSEAGSETGRGFPCEAYGEAWAGCFFEDVSGECETRLECSLRMSFERVRLWHRIRELAAEDDSPEVRAMWAEVLAGVDGPGDLLRASETGEQGPA